MAKRKTAAEHRHHDRVGQMPCIACGRWGVHVHHVVSNGYQRITRDHKLVLPLCPDCHTDGPYAVHKVSYDTFRDVMGVDQLPAAQALWDD